jgi:ABC-2 type transport system ATP-binding protein
VNKLGAIVLELNNVVKKFDKKTVVDNLSLSVEAGQIYGFLGPNGAGKTTTIKMIVGLIGIDNGNIKIQGLDVVSNHEKAMRNIGAIVENPDLYDYLSGLDNLKLYARIHDIGKDRMNEVIKLVDLELRIKDKVKKYSLGMKQRLGLAVALLHNPKLLILDEPTNGLDPAGIKKLRDILKQLAHEQGIAVFVSSHLLSEMQLMCDKVAIIDNGKMIKVENLTTETETDKNEMYILEVSDIPKSIEVLKDICQTSINENKLQVSYNGKISEIVKILVNKDIEISYVSKDANSLEQDFLNVTGGVK